MVFSSYKDDFTTMAENTSEKNGKKEKDTVQFVTSVHPETIRVLKIHAILTSKGQALLAGEVLDNWAKANPVTVSKG